MTTFSSNSPNVEIASDFPDRAGQVLGKLRSAFIDMFTDVPGGVRKSYDVNKLLGVDARLSWQVFKLTAPGDPLSLAAHVPLPAAMRRLLTAAERHGIAPQRIADVRAAFDAFEQLVAEQAGDRSIFDSMTRGLSDDEASHNIDVIHRKAIFKGQRHYLGVELETSVTSVIHYPTADPEKVDLGQIRAKFGLRRLRSDAEVIVDNAKIWNTGGVDDSFWRNTIDPEAVEKYGAALFPQFCTDPLPTLRFKDGPNGQRVTTLTGEVLGRQGAADLVFGNIWRDVQLLSAGKDGRLGFGTHVYMNLPTTLMYVDMILPNAMARHLDSELEVYAFAPVLGDIDEIKKMQPRLMFREKIVRLAGGLKGAHIREVPHYLQVVEAFYDKMKWRMEGFEVFRLCVEYPMVGSLISLRFNKTSG